MVAGPEQDAWRSLRRTVGGRWHAQRIENWVDEGTPDVAWGARGVDGWMELKALHDWPARPETGIDIGLKPEQAEWLTARGRVGSGLCFILVRIGRDWLLFHWSVARTLARGRPDRNSLLSLSDRAWRGRLNPDELIEIITEGRRDARVA